MLETVRTVGVLASLLILVAIACGATSRRYLLRAIDMAADSPALYHRELLKHAHWDFASQLLMLAAGVLMLAQSVLVWHILGTW